METIIFKDDNMEEAAKLINKGELVAFPTETVYGLGADATNDDAIKKVYQAKGRPSDNPLIVHVTGVEDVWPFVDKFSDKAQKLAKVFWPGPLTLILNIKKGMLPLSLGGGLSTVSFRMPNNKKTLELIRKAGVPLVGPSANTSGKPSPTTAAHVYHDLEGKIAGIIDDGPTEVGLESTVLDMSTDIPVILRPGAVTKEELEKVIGLVEMDGNNVGETETPRAPGMKYKHYAPNVEVMMIDRRKENWAEAIAWAKANNKKIGLLASQDTIESFEKQIDDSFVLTIHNDVVEAMQNLFSGLRFLDESSVICDIVFVQTFEEKGQGVAYMNRLMKAANKKVY